jgi:small GTP-binding protein
MKSFNRLIRKIKKSKRIIRMTVLGDGAVGKTTLIKSILDKSIISKKKETNDDGIDSEINRTPFMEIETWNLDDLMIQCYDLAGQRTPGSHPIDIMRDQVLGSIDIFLFVFSLHRFESFKNLDKWMDLLFNDTNGKKKDDVCVILIGNKLDLERNVSKELVKSVVEKEPGFKAYVETCATKNIGIEELMEKIVKLSKNYLELKN